MSLLSFVSESDKMLGNGASSDECFEANEPMLTHPTKSIPDIFCAPRKLESCSRKKGRAVPRALFGPEKLALRICMRGFPECRPLLWRVPKDDHRPRFRRRVHVSSPT
jgi:hypothetical protein